MRKLVALMLISSSAFAADEVGMYIGNRRYIRPVTINSCSAANQALTWNSTTKALGCATISSSTPTDLACTACVSVSEVNASGSPSVSTYLRGDGSWATPSTVASDVSCTACISPAEVNASGVASSSTYLRGDGSWSTPTTIATGLSCTACVEASEIEASGSPSSTTFLRGDGAWATPTAPPNFEDYNYGWCDIVLANAVAFTNMGMGGCTVSATTTTNGNSLTTQGMVSIATSGSSGNTATVSSAMNDTKPAFRPKFTANIRTHTSVTNNRIAVMITEGTGSDALSPDTGPTASSVDFVGIVHDVAVSAAWRCCSGDGTNYSCTDITGSTLAVSTDYKVVVDWSVAGTLTCSVTAGSTTSSVNKATNLSTQDVLVGPRIGIRTTANAVSTLAVGRHVLRQN